MRYKSSLHLNPPQQISDKNTLKPFYAPTVSPACNETQLLFSSYTRITAQCTPCYTGSLFVGLKRACSISKHTPCIFSLRNEKTCMTEPLHHQACTDFTRLLSIVATLRSDHGCPWDRKQTPLSLKKYLLEECQELIEAIDGGNAQAICEETGDLLFILAMLTRIFSENESFTMRDVLSAVNEKMIRRHPHVFGDVRITNEQELRRQWQRIKEQEKQSPP